MIQTTRWLNGGYKECYYYTLEEMFNDPGTIDEVPSIDLYTDICPSFMNDYWTSGKGGELWTYIFTTFRDHIAIVTDKEVDWDADRWEVTPQFWKHFWLIWTRNHKYYEKIIDLLADNESKLMDQITATTSSEGQFNDTPDQSGDYSTLNYASNITKGKVTTQSDGGTVLERLDEVRRRYSDYYTRWANEFKYLFISPLNYDKEI